MKDRIHSWEIDRDIVEQQSRLVYVSGTKCDSKELLTLDKKHALKSHSKFLGFVLNNYSHFKMKGEQFFEKCGKNDFSNLCYLQLLGIHSYWTICFWTGICK